MRQQSIAFEVCLKKWLGISLVAFGLGLTACTEDDPAAGNPGDVTLSGSATMEPITAITAREVDVEVSLQTEGTNEGFQRFCTGETDINAASTPIPSASAPEDFTALCDDHDVDYIELPIGLDALSLVINADNEFVEDLTLEELHEIWQPDSEITQWSDVRSEWPAEDIVLYGRGTGSGSFAFFTETINGQAGQIRADYQATEDLELLATWIAQEPYALGFMGIGNYLGAAEESRLEMSTITLDGIGPDHVSAASGDYPMTRPLFLYVSVSALEENPAVEPYVVHLLNSGDTILPRAFFYPLEPEAYEDALQRLNDRETGAA